MRRWRALLLTAFFIGCPKPVATPLPEETVRDAASGVAGCPRYTPAERSGVVPASLPELSGLVASAVHPNVFYAHNDSGNAFTLFAIDASGTVLGEWNLPGANPSDVEDITAGRCTPGGETRCLFLGDIGDNLERREVLTIFRTQEPATLERGGSLALEALPFRYEDGFHNAEALVLHPISGELGVISKESAGLGALYVLENLAPGQRGTARRLGPLQLGKGADRLTTAADVHPSGARLLLRTYTQAYEARVAGAEDLAALIAEPLVGAPSSAQPQSEAIAYTADGRGYLIGTEGAGEPLISVGCR